MTALLEQRTAQERVEAWLGTVTYKPGWTFDGLTSEDDTVVVGIRSRLVDIHTGEDGTFLERLVLDTRTNEGQWMLQLDATIAHIETHERMEWLRVNGVPARDPHPGGLIAYGEGQLSCAETGRGWHHSD